MMEVDKIHSILDFPMEIVQDILFYSIVARLEYTESSSLMVPAIPGLPRALRLRLVCKLFDTLFQSALFETRILDDCGPGSAGHTGINTVLEYWPSRRNSAVQRLWHAYVVYRVRNETDSAVYRYVEVRQIAEAICYEVGADLLSTIDALCWLGLGYCLGTTWKKPYPEAWEETSPSPNISLLSAAAFLGYTALTQRLLDSGNNPEHHDMLFPCPLEAAALAGQVQTLRLCQEKIAHETNRYFFHHPNLSHVRRLEGGHPYAIAGAASGGNMDVLEIALYPACFPSTMDDISVHETIRALNSTYFALRYAKTWPVFQRLSAPLRPGFYGGKGGAGMLRHFSELGNFEIVKGLLDAGAPVDGEADKHFCVRSTPLWEAARHGHEDIVHLLLERGASLHMHYFEGYPVLGAAIHSGCIGIVRTLLTCGAVCDRRSVRMAAVMEHAAIVELLDDHWSPDPDIEKAFSSLVERAREKGLTSMLKLLCELGQGINIEGEVWSRWELFY